ncbi:hypothetical protein KWG76_13945 [Haloterrigena longa]|uniref:Uncharacterized protein n=1 Tax=Natrinema longum TaxID=370324 RepID=A0A8A2UJG6_9EURY|nr:hypothetical protein [Natrinema longum]QSW86938.1 hypothetical protein J0X27_04285 [Natrinema longum]
MLPIDGVGTQLTTETPTRSDIDDLLETGLERREWLVFKQASTFVGEFAIVSYVDDDWWVTIATAHPILGIDRTPPKQVSRDTIRSWGIDHDAYLCQL